MPQLYREVLLSAEARISYGDSVCLSVTNRCAHAGKMRTCGPADLTDWLTGLFTCGTDSRPGEIDSGSSPYDSLGSLVFNEVILVPLGEEIPLARGRQRGVPPLEIVILPLLAHLAWKRLQLDTDLLRIIRSTADELSSGTNIDDLERPWTPNIGVFSDFLAMLGCNTH